MDTYRPVPRRRLAALAAVLMIVSLGCLCLPLNLVSTPTPAPIPTLPPIPVTVPPVTLPPVTVTPLSPIIPTPTGTAASTGDVLSATGPWLLIETAQGLYATNPDGTALSQVSPADDWHGNVKYAIQPGGIHFASVTPVYNRSSQDLEYVELFEYALPIRAKKIGDISHGAVDPATGKLDPLSPAVRAITEQRSFAWSPDGTKLAFIGAIDGPSADLYLYDESTGTITRVSSDPDQDFFPSWSPDGQHIVYLEARGFGTGAGMSMSAVWVANGDGTGATRLYDTSSAGEEIVGWLDSTTVILDTWSVVCGSGNLRLYNVVTRATTVLAKGCIHSATASDGRESAMYSDDTGTYYLTAGDRTPVKVSDEKNAMIKPWGPDDQVFTVRFDDASLATFGENELDHAVSPITAEPDLSMLPFDQTDMSFYALIWGWTSRIPEQPGAWITGPGIEIGQVFDAPARFPTWSAHNNFIFFAPLEGGYDMYLTTFDSHYTDLHVVNHIDADILGTVWIGPPQW